MELFDTLEFVGGASGGQAHLRNLIGSVAAEIGSRVLHATLLPIDGRRKVCPDFCLRGYEGEIKSCRAGHRRSTIYKFRLEKEAAYCDPEKYLYVFLSHAASAMSDCREDVVGAFSKGVDLHCATLAEVMAGVQGATLRTMRVPPEPDKRVGYYREGYRDGFYLFNFLKLPWREESELRQVQITRAPVAARVYISEGWQRLFQ